MGVKRKPTIAMDIDDCLALFADRLAGYSNDKWGHKLGAEDYLENWATMWGVSWDEVQKRIDTMFVDEEFYPTLGVVEGAREALEELGARYELVALTSRSGSLLGEMTRAWLDKEFPGKFRELRHLGSWASVSEFNLELTKGQVCKELGAEFLIDDQPKHCNAAAEVGVKALLFGDYKWNRAADIHDGVVRTRDWGSVMKYFNGEEVR